MEKKYGATSKEDTHRPRKRSRLITCGTGPSAIAQMRDSSDLLSDYNLLKARLNSDGYLFLRDFLPRSDVIKARTEILKVVMAEVPHEAISRFECPYRPLEVVLHVTAITLALC
eukprot:jgi/Bigna1/83082/fgenesh1_pg.101_\